LLSRDIIGVDINPEALDRCYEKLSFERKDTGEAFIRQGDARNLDFLKADRKEFAWQSI